MLGAALTSNLDTRVENCVPMLLGVNTARTHRARLFVKQGYLTDQRNSDNSH